MRCEKPVAFINDRGNMHVLMGVDAAHDGTRLIFLTVHFQYLLARPLFDGFADRVRGQDSHETKRSGPSRVTGIGEAKPHRKAFPDDRQVQGKTRLVDLCLGQIAPGRPTAPAYQTVHRCKSQTVPELALIF